MPFPMVVRIDGGPTAVLLLPNVEIVQLRDPEGRVIAEKIVYEPPISAQPEPQRDSTR